MLYCINIQFYKWSKSFAIGVMSHNEVQTHKMLYKSEE